LVVVEQIISHQQFLLQPGKTAGQAEAGYRTQVLEPEFNHPNQALAALMALETMDQALQLGQIEVAGEVGQAVLLQEGLTLRAGLGNQVQFLEQALLMQAVEGVARMEAVLLLGLVAAALAATA
jgi:hypothetical protein